MSAVNRFVGQNVFYYCQVRLYDIQRMALRLWITPPDARMRGGCGGLSVVELDKLS